AAQLPHVVLRLNRAVAEAGDLLLQRGPLPLEGAQLLDPRRQRLFGFPGGPALQREPVPHLVLGRRPRVEARPDFPMLPFRRDELLRRRLPLALRLLGPAPRLGPLLLVPLPAPPGVGQPLARISSPCRSVLPFCRASERICDWTSAIRSSSRCRSVAVSSSRRSVLCFRSR